MSPASPNLSAGTFFCFEYMKLQISSHCTRFDATFFTVSSWNIAQALPTLTNSLTIVFFEHPVKRVVALILMPSTRQVIICTLFSNGSIFIHFELGYKDTNLFLTVSIKSQFKLK